VVNLYRKTVQQPRLSASPRLAAARVDLDTVLARQQRTSR
jgi:hypothetical protein